MGRLRALLSATLCGWFSDTATLLGSRRRPERAAENPDAQGTPARQATCPVEQALRQDAIDRYLKGEVIQGWEHPEDILARIAQLRLDFRSSDREHRSCLVSHGLFFTTG